MDEHQRRPLTPAAWDTSWRHDDDKMFGARPLGQDISGRRTLAAS